MLLMHPAVTRVNDDSCAMACCSSIAKVMICRETVIFPGMCEAGTDMLLTSEGRNLPHLAVLPAMRAFAAILQRLNLSAKRQPVSVGAPGVGKGC